MIAAASENRIRFDDFVAVGELSLHGHVRPVRAALGASVVAEQQGKTCLMSSDSVVAVSQDTRIAGVSTLLHAVQVAEGRRGPDQVIAPDGETSADADLHDVREQHFARRALEIAAAGRHHLLLVGPPGAGKTLLSRCLPSILPKLTPSEQREVSLVWAASGMDRAVCDLPPFCAPHHSSSMASLVGGGAGSPTPGEVSRAHRGVLFLDELGEFPSNILGALRQPVEDGFVTVARQAASFRFPTLVQLVAASNPCPCGNKGDRHKSCTCLDTPAARYAAKLAGPLADRFDMRVDMKRLRTSSLAGPRGEASSDVRPRVAMARELQRDRGVLNSELSGASLDGFPWTDSAMSVLQASAEEAALSARGWDRVRRVSVTIADLDSSELIEARHVKEAAALRGELL